MPLTGNSQIIPHRLTKQIALKSSLSLGMNHGISIPTNTSWTYSAKLLHPGLKPQGTAGRRTGLSRAFSPVRSRNGNHGTLHTGIQKPVQQFLSAHLLSQRTLAEQHVPLRQPLDAQAASLLFTATSAGLQAPGLCPWQPHLYTGQGQSISHGI